MSTPQLLRLTHAKIDACHTLAPDSSGLKDEAAALLAEVFLVGLKRGITPGDWAGVADLPTSCLDACRQRRAAAALRRTAPPWSALSRGVDVGCPPRQVPLEPGRSQEWG